MIQIAVLPATSQTAIPPGIPGENGAEQLQTGGFAKLLSQQPGASAVAGPAVAAPDENISLQQPALSLPHSGKTLPPVATEVAGNGPAAANAVDILPLGSLIPAIGGPAINTAPARKTASQSEDQEPASEPSEATTDFILFPSDQGTLPVNLPGGLVATPVASGVTSPTEPADPKSAPSSAAAPQLSRLIEQQLAGRPLTHAALTTAAQSGTGQSGRPAPQLAETTGGGQIRLLPLDALRRDAMPAAAFTLGSPAAPLEPGALHMRPALGMSPAERLSAKEPESLAGATLLSPVDATTTAAFAPITAAAPAPALAHDFATLIDRLIAARDAAAPPPVNISVDHADFGTISLRFQHDGAGLSVSLANPDPDFARAVQAATPLVSAATATSSENQTGANASQSGQNSAGRQDSAAGSPSGQSQARPDRREPARHETDATPARSDDPAGSRRGVFA